MASGRGSNFQAIIDAGVRGETPNVEIVHLIVNKKNANGDTILHLLMKRKTKYMSEIY